jgi:hypothetical protein
VEAAWRFKDAGHQDEALAYAYTCCHLYMEAARIQQKQAARPIADGGIPDKWAIGDSPEMQQRIFSFWALNDCGAALWIQMVIRLGRGDKVGAKAALRAILFEVPKAMVWDPKGWFWKPSVSARAEYPALVREVEAEERNRGNAR